MGFDRIPNHETCRDIVPRPRTRSIIFRHQSLITLPPPLTSHQSRLTSHSRASGLFLDYSPFRFKMSHDQRFKGEPEKWSLRSSPIKKSKRLKKERSESGMFMLISCAGKQMSDPSRWRSQFNRRLCAAKRPASCWVGAASWNGVNARVGSPPLDKANDQRSSSALILKPRNCVSPGASCPELGFFPAVF